MAQPRQAGGNSVQVALHVLRESRNHDAGSKRGIPERSTETTDQQGHAGEVLVQIRRDSKLVKWAEYAPWMPRIYSRVSLCKFFWTAFVLATLSNVIWGTMLVIFYPFLLLGCGIAILDKRYRWSNKYWTSEDWANYGTESRADKAARWIFNTAETIQNSIFWQGLKTIKGKMCPIIEIVEPAKQR